MYIYEWLHACSSWYVSRKKSRFVFLVIAVYTDWQYIPYMYTTGTYIYVRTYIRTVIDVLKFNIAIYTIITLPGINNGQKGQLNWLYVCRYYKHS